MIEGYDLTDQETEWVNMIQAKTSQDLEERGIKTNYDSILTASIFGVTLFTRKLKLVDKSQSKPKVKNG